MNPFETYLWKISDIQRGAPETSYYGPTGNLINQIRHQAFPCFQISSNSVESG